MIINDLKRVLRDLCFEEKLSDRDRESMHDKLKACLNVRGVVSRLRCQRDGSVQTKTQYAMIYNYIHEVLRQKVGHLQE